MFAIPNEHFAQLTLSYHLLTIIAHGAILRVSCCVIFLRNQ